MNNAHLPVRLLPVVPTTGLTVLLSVLAPSIAAAELDPDCRQLGGGLTDHSCFHTDFGPFEEVNAATAGEPLSAAPDISDVHTHYTVQLPGRGPGLVRYRPKRTGAWALFSTQDVAFEVRDAEGEPVAPIVEHDVTTCAALPRVEVFDLEADRTYGVIVASDDTAAVPIVVENVQDFEVEYGRDGDLDGFGSFDVTVVTSCMPPEGFVSELGDCDDDDPGVNPGAAEVCDGIDNDCDGLVDGEDDDSPCAPEADPLSERGCTCRSGSDGDGAAFLALVLAGGWFPRRRR